MRTILMAILASLLAGCGSDLPTYPPMAPEEAWRIVADRASMIRAVSAEADATLTGADATSLRVDAALVMAPPDRVRLRAWKVGHAVLDVTSDAGAVWVDSPPAPDGRAGTETLGVAPDDLARGLLLMPAWAFVAEVPARAERHAGRYVFELSTDLGDLTCEVAERTLAVRRWSMAGDAHGDRTLELSDHRLVGGVPWAHEAMLRAGGRSIRLRLRNVDLAHQPDPRAFTPPAGARRLP
jgi:hypothetical protein